MVSAPRQLYHDILLFNLDWRNRPEQKVAEIFFSSYEWKKVSPINKVQFFKAGIVTVVTDSLGHKEPVANHN